MIYQVYPRSFQDSDGDGVGDLRGLRTRLDHLEWLGVDAVWLSPVFPSPMADFGYDVADYTDIDPLFGGLADLDALVEDLHRRGMRLLLDFVPNHTSDQHPWFIDSRSSRSAARRDWYIWRDPAPGGGPPNDWQSVFRGSAWEWDAATQQYYFHSFLNEQPDLDWTNPAVREAMIDVLHFWLARGIDGFRVDVISLLGKGPELEAGALLRTTVTRSAISRSCTTSSPSCEPSFDGYRDRLIIGELYLPPERTILYYGAEGRGIHLPFNFTLLTIDWHATAVHASIKRYEEALPDSAWPNWVLGNHDNPRVAARIGAAQARVAAVLLLTLRGTPTLYYGDEIGMADVEINSAAQRDPQGLRGGINRDPARTPMRWDSTPRAGFTSGTPWLPMGPDVDTTNVLAQHAQPRSMLSLHRRLLRLRRGEQALNAGAWDDLGQAGSTLAYIRSAGDRRYLVCLNLAAKPGQLPASTNELAGGVVVSTLSEDVARRFDPRSPLAGDEGLVVLLD